MANFSDRSDLINPIVNSSCIGESPGKKLDQCRFNGYFRQLFFSKILTHRNSDLLFLRTQSSRTLVLCFNRIWENDDSKSFKRKIVSAMMSCAFRVERKSSKNSAKNFVKPQKGLYLEAIY